MSKEFHRLPDTIVPKRYNLHLYPNLETFKFKGELEVELDVKEDTAQILCYAAELEIFSAQIGDQIAKIQLLPEEERVLFSFDEKIVAGDHSLKISYSGCHNDKRMGFYRSKLMVQFPKNLEIIAFSLKPLNEEFSVCLNRTVQN